MREANPSPLAVLPTARSASGRMPGPIRREERPLRLSAADCSAGDLQPGDPGRPRARAASLAATRTLRARGDHDMVMSTFLINPDARP